MNYFHKNLKELRKLKGLNQEQFARLFFLNKANVQSYEISTFPKIEKYHEIVEYFDLDAVKFVQCDMTKVSVFKEDNTKPDEAATADKIDRWTDPHNANKDQFQYVNDLSLEELKSMYVRHSITIKELMHENLTLKEKYIQLLEKTQESKE
ncbi:MAG: helix-turn-helix transcriptional regulator [Cytophagales bacterium]|nr:helix-turn-helix transcriptional regulator [Cytophagales bacterium]